MKNKKNLTEILYDVKKADAMFPNTIQELVRTLIKLDRKKKIEKLNEK